MVISNQPPKGTADWLPKELKIRQAIFGMWRKICQKYGYEEYLTPIVESAEIYRAKSGEDVGGKELVTFTDLGGRELAIRPEMTPSVTRLVSQIYEAAPKPIRYFSIANFMRNEKPQRGRNREFWQLNCDIFGSDSLQAEIEILQLALDIMLAFGATPEHFSLGLNHRILLDGILAEVLDDDSKKIQVVRLLDKYQKMSRADFGQALAEAGVSEEGVKKLLAFMQAESLEELIKKIPKLKNNAGVNDLALVMQNLAELGYGDFIKFKPDVIRGFDYYDGLVFEVFDLHPDNKRALFGGGRYNGLANIFGTKSFPAVGFAPGDEPTKLFLESWKLLDNLLFNSDILYYLPILDNSLKQQAAKLAQLLRSNNKHVILGLEEAKVGKALDWANKQNATHVIIFGLDEAKRKIYKIKDMATGKEKKEKFKF